MSDLVVIAVILILFGGLSWRVWTKDIGAGPTVLIVGVICLVAYIGWRTNSDQDARERKRLAADAAQVDYNTKRAAWIVDRSLYLGCLQRTEDQVKARTALRVELRDDAISLSDSVLKVFPDSPEAKSTMLDYVTHRLAHIDENYAELDLATLRTQQCVDPGPEPVAPKGVTSGPPAVTTTG